MNMDKLEQFIQMLDEPDRYSDEQWQQQLSDTELGDAYAMMVMLDRAAAEQSRRAERGIPSTATVPMCRFLVAAVVCGILLLSGIAYAVIQHTTNRHPVHETPVVERSQPFDGSSASYTVITSQPPRTFENAKLEDILDEVATHYHVTVVYRSEAARRLRLYITWDPSQTIDETVALFNNFEKVHLTLDGQTLTVGNERLKIKN